MLPLGAVLQHDRLGPETLQFLRAEPCLQRRLDLVDDDGVPVVDRRTSRLQGDARLIAPLLTVSFSDERDIGRLKEGRFVTTLVGTRARLNISPDLTVSSFVQYDTDRRSFGTNARLRWTFRPAGDLFVIYNHNLADVTDRWRFDSNQLPVKLQYSFRY